MNDTYEGGRVRSIYVQLEGDERNGPADLTNLMVRNRQGEMISVASVAQLTREEGANSISHYGLNRAIRITALPRQKISSGQAIQMLKRTGEQIGGNNIGLAFTGLAKEEQKAQLGARVVTQSNLKGVQLVTPPLVLCQILRTLSVISRFFLN